MTQLKITVHNGFTFISKNFNALPQSVQNKFVKQLSYRKKSEQYQYKFNEIYLLFKNSNSNGNLDKYYQMPTGLLYRFYKLAKQYDIPLQFTDNRGPKPPLLPIQGFFDRLRRVNSDIERRDYQVEAIQKCLKFGRGLIEHSTAAGKTIVIAGVSYAINNRILILCIGKSSKEHIRQMSKDIESMTGCEVSIYGGEYRDLSGQIVVANYQALNSLRKNNYEKFKRVMASFMCVIEDECHRGASESNLQIMYHAVNAYFKYGFSGTMHREDGAFLEVEGAIGPVLDQKDYSYLQEKDKIVQAKFYFIDPKCNTLHGERDTWPACLQAGIVHNQKRNEWIARICGLYARKKLQVLVISPFRVEHGAILQDLIEDSRFMFGESNEFIRKQTLLDFKNKLFHVLIASTIYDEVINLPDVRAIILAGGGKAHNAFFQRVGRGIRKAPGKTHVDIIIPWDSHSSVLLRHTKTLKRYIGRIAVWRDHIKMLGDYRPQHRGVKTA